MFQSCYRGEYENFVERQSVDEIDANHSALLREYLNDYTNHFRDVPITFGLVLMRNKQKSTAPARFPPHTDFHRQLAINIVLELGGDNVVTEIYDRTGVEPGVYIKRYDVSYWNHKALPVLASRVIEQNRWHTFPAHYPHGVKNLQTRRTVLIINIPKGYPQYGFDYARNLANGAVR
jgi:hypothetical protein